MSFSLPSGVARMRPSAETNSVQNTSGPPSVPSFRMCREYVAITFRKDASVTFASGASTIIGFGSRCQKDMCEVIPHFLLLWKVGDYFRRRTRYFIHRIIHKHLVIKSDVNVFEISWFYMFKFRRF